PAYATARITLRNNMWSGRDLIQNLQTHTIREEAENRHIGHLADLSPRHSAARRRRATNRAIRPTYLRSQTHLSDFPTKKVDL
ncbi:hypothetical protein, partial [Roseovarius sp. SYSU LYC5161]|uniref:hypothetical protein n=1 Tax=Roseovarius halophilus (ex Wu et al. 2025) TaxID=3376060 RepID=UPI00399A5CF4